MKTQPQIGEWWWVMFGGDPEIARVVSVVSDTEYIVLFWKYHDCVRLRHSFMMLAKVEPNDIPKPGLFCRLFALLGFWL